MPIGPAEQITDILPDEKTKVAPSEVPNSSNDLVQELWPGYKVTSEAGGDVTSELEIPKSRKERSEFLNRMAEESFTEQEKELWEPNIRRALVAFHIHGFLEYSESEEQGSVRALVFDTQKLKDELRWSDIRDDIGPLANDRGRRRVRVETLADFSEKIGQVYSVDNPKQAKYLYYVPKGDSYDPEQIKLNECHLGLWEGLGYFTSADVFTSEGVKEISQETVVSALVYHPNWGNGFRDEHGVLQVIYPDGSMGGVTGQFFRDWGFGGGMGESLNKIYNSPREYTRDNCPTLVERGILTPNDFRGHSGEGGYFEFGRTNEIAPGKSGRVMIDGVLYILGSEYVEESYKVAKVSSEYACVVKTTKRGTGQHLDIVRVFELLSKEEKARIKETKNFPFVSQRELIERGLLTIDDFVERDQNAAQILSEWKDFLSFSNRLEDMGVGIVNYPVRQQAMLWEAFNYGKAKKLILDFVGDEGLGEEEKHYRLKTLLALQGNFPDTSISQVIEIGKQRGAEFLFENMAAISDLMSSTEEMVVNSEVYSDVELDRIRQINDMIIKHAGKVFLASYEVAKGNNGVSMQDAVFILNRFRRSVERWQQEQFLRGTTSETNKYLKLLNSYDSIEPGSNMQTLLLGMIEEYWREDVYKESLGSGRSISTALDRIKEFYEGNEELFETAAQTTGDTEKELTGLKKFFENLNEIDGYVLDLACGDRKRITVPMAQMLEGKAKVLGMDIWSPGTNQEGNLDVIQGSIDLIPLPDRSVSVATLNWSPLNDWVERNSQLVNFSELGRVMKVGGVVRADVAYLEGGEGSWEEEVQKQYREGGGAYGDIKVMFPGGREGEFHIYPYAELKGMFNKAGFGEVSYEVWETASGKPRVVVNAVFTGKENPLS
jgi:hypothetical protein